MTAHYILRQVSEPLKDQPEIGSERTSACESQSSDTSERGVVPLERCFQTGTLKDRGCLQALPEHKPLLVRRYKVMLGYIPYGTKPIIQ